jgi:hypothetical protein
VNHLSVTVLALGLSFISTAVAHAQQEPVPQKVFVNFNVSARQGASRLDVTSSFPTSGQTATIEIDDDISGGPLWDGFVAVKPWRYLAVGAGYSRIRSRDFDQYVASIPVPVPGNLPVTIRAITGALHHQENIAYVSALWMKPVTQKFSLALSAGPAFFTVKQDVPTSANVSVIPVPPGRVISGLNLSTRDESGVGYHAAMDLDYMFTKVLGGGLLMRYIGGSVDLPDSATSMSVGGLQIGAGIRARF